MKYNGWNETVTHMSRNSTVGGLVIQRRESRVGQRTYQELGSKQVLELLHRRSHCVGRIQLQTMKHTLPRDKQLHISILCWME